VSVAGTYADALFQAADDADAVPDVARDLEEFRRAAAESDELRLVLENPEVDVRRRKGVVAALTEGAHPLVGSFLQVLVDRGRIGELQAVADAFRARVDKAEGRMEVHAITAVPMPDDLRDLIAKRLEEKTGRRVELTESVDPEIIGGLVLRVEGAAVDASLRRRIEDLRATLRAAPVDAAATTT
jgi:F-type H+-transporting ATPase subunit delta